MQGANPAGSRTAEAIHDAIRWAEMNNDLEMAGRLVRIVCLLGRGEPSCMPADE